MTQTTFATALGFERFRKTTRRDVFLAEMNRVVPWESLCAVIEPVYPKPEGAGRRPVGIERMLRIYFLQQWFNLSDPSVEEALYDSLAMRTFVDIDLGREPVPDETTVCRFRHLLEAHRLGPTLFETVNQHLHALGIGSPPAPLWMPRLSTLPVRRRTPRRLGIPEMHQTAKGKQWYFGMKAHVGVDSQESS